MSALVSSRTRRSRGTAAVTRGHRRPLGSVTIAAQSDRPAGSESLLAIMTSWALFAAFGLCFVLSGLAESNLAVGLLGFAAFMAGFGAHVVINRIFGGGFSAPQATLALGAFTVGVLCFIAGAIFDPGFTATDLLIGIVGFGGLITAFLLYVLIRYGIRGSYDMLHQLHRGGRQVP